MRYNEIVWSPDGTRIAYGDNLVDHFGIFTANPDGTDATQLTDGVNDGWPSWSPDGTRIAFSGSLRDPDVKPCGSRVDFQCPADIYVMNSDGTGVRRLTEDPAADFQPAWSPDGTKFAFERAIDDGTGTAIFVMNADGTDVKQVSSARGGSDMYASWSPNGSQIVFSSIRYEDWGIYVVNADGTNEHPLLAKGGYADDPVWSPDGRFIAFIGEGFSGAVDTGGESALYVMDPDGTDVAKIADAPAGVAGNLAWQPLPIAESPTPSASGPSASAWLPPSTWGRPGRRRRFSTPREASGSRRTESRGAEGPTGPCSTA
jgi:Tol biopolymer transport system component